MAAYGGKQHAVLLYFTLLHAPSQHTCCCPVPALAVVSPIHCSRSWAPPIPRHFTHSKVGGGLKGGSQEVGI